MRKSLWIIALLCAAIGTPTVVRASTTDITYFVNQPLTSGVFIPGSLTGSITTDGTIGTLSGSDVIGWDLKAIDGNVTGIFSSLDPGAVSSLFGDGLTASATELLFNFSSIENGQLVFRELNILEPGVGDIQWLDSDTGFTSSVAIFDWHYPEYIGVPAYQPMPQDIEVIASVPEPGDGSLLLIGIGFALAMRKLISQGLP
jgi:hypothetical protein